MQQRGIYIPRPEKKAKPFNPNFNSVPTIQKINEVRKLPKKAYNSYSKTNHKRFKTDMKLNERHTRRQKVQWPKKLENVIVLSMHTS